MALDAGAGLLNVLHALAQFALNAPALLLTHVIQLGQRLFDLRKNGGFQFTFRGARGRIHGARHAQNDVEVGLGGQAEFRGSRAERLDVAAHHFAIQRKAFTAAAIEAEREFEVAARNLLFEQAAQLHLEARRSRKACGNADRGSGD